MPPSVYIDQSRFIQLLQSEVGSFRAPTGASEALEALREAVARGVLVVPLSVAHYHETWHVHDWRRRHDLARLMRDLSGYATLAPIQRVTALEVAAVLGGPPVGTVIGRGANFAFDSRTGRLTVVEEAELDELYPQASAALESPFAALVKTLDAEAWEWFNLAGFEEDFPMALPDGLRLDFRPEHARGDDWAQDEEAVRAEIESRGHIGRLRDELVRRDLSSFASTVDRVATARGVTLGSAIGASDAEIRRFHASIPSRSTLVELTYHRLKESQYRPQQHDRLDLLAHATAFVYCDLVVTERRMADLARRASVQRRFGTRVTHSLAELPEVIADLAS